MTKYSEEEKSVIITARMALDIALHNISWRWLLCEDGIKEEHTFPSDCACCITWMYDDLGHRCQCVCHERMREFERCFTSALEGIRDQHHSWMWNRGIDGKKREEES